MSEKRWDFKALAVHIDTIKKYDQPYLSDEYNDAIAELSNFFAEVLDIVTDDNLNQIKTMMKNREKIKTLEVQNRNLTERIEHLEDSITGDSHA